MLIENPREINLHLANLYLLDMDSSNTDEWTAVMKKVVEIDAKFRRYPAYNYVAAHKFW